MEERKTSKNLGYYFFILGGHATSLFGSSVVQFIIILWITSETSSVFYVSLTLFLTFLPQVIITLFAGVLSDILNRKLILIIANTLRISTTFVLIFLFAFGTFELNILLFISIIRGISQAFYLPTFYTILPSMVSQKHLGRINGITYLLMMVFQMVTPLYSSILFNDFPINLSLWVMVIVSGITLIPLIFIKIPQVKDLSLKSENHEVNSSIVHYFRHFKEGFRTLVLIPSIIILFGAILIFDYFTIQFNTPSTYYLFMFHGGSFFLISTLSTSMFIGIVIGTIVFEIRKYWSPTIFIFFLSMFLVFLGNLVFILAPYQMFGLLIIVYFIQGFHMVFVYTMFQTFIQSTVPNNKLGRVSAIYFTMSSFVTLFAPFSLNLVFIFISDIRLILLLITITGIISLIALYMFTGIRKLQFENYKNQSNGQIHS